MKLFSKAMAFVGDNAKQVDAEKFEKELREQCPRLLREDEKVIMGFKDRGGAGRDDKCFTDKRILLRNKKGLTGQCQNYQSIPYQSIKAYSIDTAGALDTDCTLCVWSQGIGRIAMDFMAGQVDMFAMKRHFNQFILVGGAIGAAEAKAEATIEDPTPDTAAGKIMGILGGDASQIDAQAVETQLKTEPKMLLDDEKVEMAFKCGRDSFILTSKRVLQIDVQGITGKKVEYKSIIWASVKMFSVETAGSWDFDATCCLFTDITGLGRIEQDFRKGKADVMAIQKYFADKLLGLDTTEFSAEAVTMEGKKDEGSGSILAWLGNDSRMVDATDMNQRFHSSPPILQGSEHVEMAFKGRRDLVLFTNKRFLMVDQKGFSGKKTNYISVPWPAVQAFGVRSAGAWLDKDSEMMIWTSVNDIYYPPKQSENDPPPSPIPRMSYIEIDFQKDKVDLLAINRYLGERILQTQGGGFKPPEVNVDPAIMKASPPSTLENFLNWVGDDARFIPASELQQQLSTVTPMLQADEGVGMGFKVGRDMIIFTTKRVISIDVQGWSGKKVEYKSIPYTSMRAFAVESAGSFDRDAEVKMYCKTFWINNAPSCIFKQDLRKGRADIIHMQSYLAAQIFGWNDGTSVNLEPLDAPTPETPEGLTKFLEFIGDNAHEIKAADVDEQLHIAPKILQPDEKVEKAYKVGRDSCIFTTKRVLYVDVKGWTGKKVEYMSYPLSYCTNFDCQTAGAGLAAYVGFSAHAAVQCDIPGAGEFKQDLSKGKTDIWDVQEHLAAKLLMPAITSTNPAIGQGYSSNAAPEAPTNDVA